MRLDPNRIPTRDQLFVAIIKGATKAAVHVDRKKQASRHACRGRVTTESTR